MAKKKKTLSDKNYEGFNEIIIQAEAENDSNNTHILTFYHDNGTLWYQGKRGNYGERDFVRHRLLYPPIPFSVMLESDALNRFRKVTNDENSSFEDVYMAYVNEGLVVGLDDEPVNPEDYENAAALALVFAIWLQDIKGMEDPIISLSTCAAEMFREAAKTHPSVYDQYWVECLSLRASAMMWKGDFDEAEKGYLETLDICRMDMIKYSPIDWTSKLLAQYWYLGNLYKKWDKTENAIKFYEEGLRTYLVSSTPVAKYVVDGISDSLCQLYEQHGMADKLQRLRSQIEEDTTE